MPLFFEFATNPLLPFNQKLNVPLHDGALIIINGRTNANFSRFAIDFVKGEQTIALHFNPRLSESVVVRNSCLNGKWGKEERQADHKFPFAADKKFEVWFLVRKKSIMMAINGEHFAEFDHRFDFQQITHVIISGDLTLNSFVYKDDFAISGALTLEATKTKWDTMYNLKVPLSMSIKHLVKDGFTMFINGRPKELAKSFTFNFIAENRDVCIHINPRFEERAVVRNTRENGKWGQEERQMPNFSFIPMVNFDMFIKFETKRAIVVLDGTYWFDYYHRLPLNKIEWLEIDGDLTVTCIRFNQATDPNKPSAHQSI